MTDLDFVEFSGLSKWIVGPNLPCSVNHKPAKQKYYGWGAFSPPIFRGRKITAGYNHKVSISKIVSAFSGILIGYLFLLLFFGEEKLLQAITIKCQFRKLCQNFPVFLLVIFLLHCQFPVPNNSITFSPVTKIFKVKSFALVFGLRPFIYFLSYHKKC